jgi:hypothetical protein
MSTHSVGAPWLRGAHEEAQMPDLKIKDIKMPELHLPEMSRDDIVQAMGDARRDFDLSRFDPRKLDLPEVDISKVDLSKVDVPKAIADAAAAAGIVRASRRPRLPFIVGGLVTIGLVSFAVRNSPMIKARLSELARRAKERMDERRAARLGGSDLEPRAFDAAVAVPVEGSAYTDATTGDSPFDGPSDLPPGLGADVYKDTPVEEHARA